MKHLLFGIAMTLLCTGYTNTTEKTKTSNKNSRMVTIHNKITADMIKYWSYVPEFILSINGQWVKNGTHATIPVTHDTLLVRYDYNFANGYYTGAKEVTFALDPQKNDYDMSFSWKNKFRVLMTGAKPNQVKRCKYNA